MQMQKQHAWQQGTEDETEHLQLLHHHKTVQELLKADHDFR